MLSLVAIDIGSSSVKAAVLTGSQPAGPLVREAFDTDYDEVRAEVPAERILRAVARAARRAVIDSVPGKRKLDVLAMCCMSPSWVAIGRRGQALTPVITHQDRRSVEQARWLLREVGLERHLAMTGNLPVPGGISSTTARWFVEHHPAVLRRARLVGHLQTLLLHNLTGARAIDPSNASFTGLWNTTDTRAHLPDWNQQLVELVGLPGAVLPAVLSGDSVAGHLTPDAARRLGLLQGLPVLTGVMDTSAAVLLAGTRQGTVVNASGSTDALAVVTEQPRPDPRCLTRHLGVGRRWLSVMTLAAAGSALAWVRTRWFRDFTDAEFLSAVDRLLGQGWPPDTGGVVCRPYFAGSRTQVEQPSASFEGIRLSTTREQLLAAVVVALAEASAERWPVLSKACGGRLRRTVLRTGGTGKVLASILNARWPRGLRVLDVDEAALRGLGVLGQGGRV